MFHSVGLTTLLALGFLAKRVVAAPAPAPRGGSSVSLSPPIIVSPTLMYALEISWGSCKSFGVNSTDPNLQCGYLEVPMDYHDSSAGKARLAVAKYAATASKKLGSLFFNPGNQLYPSFLTFPQISNFRRRSWWFGNRDRCDDWSGNQPTVWWHL